MKDDRSLFTRFVQAPVDFFGWLYDKLFPVSAVVTVLLPPIILYVLVDLTLHGK